MANQASFVNVTAGISQENPSPSATPEVSVVGEVVESVKPPTLLYSCRSIRARVPQELKDLPQWMIWSNTWLKKTGTWAKQPRRIEAGVDDKNKPRKRYTACGYKDTLTTLDVAIARVDQVSFLSGIGFALIGTGVTGVDIDGYAPGSEWAEEIIRKFEAIGAYMEVSPSGKGVRVFCRGKLTAALSHKFEGEHTAIESWDDGRYVTVTGVPLARDGAEVGKLWAGVGEPERGGRDLPDGQEVLDWLQAKYRKQPLTEEVTTAHKSNLAAYKPAPGESNDDTDYPWACEVLFNGHFDGLVDDYHLWLKVGMTLVSRFGPHTGADLWDRWSQRGANYQTGICRMKVSSFKKDGLNFGSFVEWAKQAGAPLQAKNDPNHPDRWQKRPTSQPATADATPTGGDDNTNDNLSDDPDDRYVSDEAFIKLLRSIMPSKYSDGQFARLIMAIHGHKMRYVEDWAAKPWMIYDRRRGVWTRSKIKHQQFIMNVASRIVIENHMPYTATAKVNACAARIAADPAVLTDISSVDAVPTILNVANGVLDLETLELYPHSHKFLTLKQAPTVYNPNAQGTKWRENLANYLPDEDVRWYVQKFLGSALLGRPMTEALMCHGGGANGKTTVMAAVARVLGNYTAKLPNGFIAEPKGDKHPTDMTLLCGARFAIASETKMTDRLDEAKMKAILGDGTISARRMHEDFWDFEPTHNLVICVNHLPKISGQDDGIWRRFRFINWPYQVPAKQRIENFDEVLFNEEGSGILNWLLEGLAGFKSEGMLPPASVMADTAKARENANWAAQFVAGYTAFEVDMETPLDTGQHRLKLADVYERYVQKTKAEGETVLTSRLATPAICEAFEAMGVKCVKVQGSWRAMGVREKTDKDYENELDQAIKATPPPAGSLGDDDDERWSFNDRF